MVQSAEGDEECSPSVDTNPHCVKWAEDGECKRNPGYMATACPESCKDTITTHGQKGNAAETQNAQKDTPVVEFSWPEPLLAPDLAAAQREVDEQQGETWPKDCRDMRNDCVALARGNLSGCGEAAMMTSHCAQTCRACAHQQPIRAQAECIDSVRNCHSWAKAGECKRNRKYMVGQCAKACGMCAEKKSGCVRRNPTPGVRAPAGMEKMFERALSPLFEHLQPQVLSSEPYVLQFENMVTAEEAAQIISLSETKLFRSRAGDAVSPVRTSTQYWCEDADGCSQDAAVKALTARAANLTQMPAENAEFLQILRYEHGQFYRAHHDQQSAVWTPQGVRVYTFFVYLSDVPAGGGTKFNELGITVTPKLGRAVLWPNVQGHDVQTSEKMTRHEALDVERGVKYAANLWFHLYDYRSPTRSGACPFVTTNTYQV